MMYEYLRVTGAHEAVLDYSDFFRVTLHGDDVQDFDAKWEEVLLSIKRSTLSRHSGKFVYDAHTCVR